SRPCPAPSPVACLYLPDALPIYHPILFYAAYFTVRAPDFELDTMIRGSEAIRARIEEILAKGNDASPKEKNLLTLLEISLEMCERVFSCDNVDLYYLIANEFLYYGYNLIALL